MTRAMPIGMGCLRAAGLALLLVLADAPARAQNMAYVKDLPTPAEIEARFAVADTEQSLGRQCAALDMLWRAGGTRFFTYADADKPEMKAALQRYSDAMTALRARYVREVGPLDTPQAQRRWRDRLCANAPDGVNPMTGKPDPSYPGLRQPVKTEEIVALFKPSVQAAHARMQAQARRAQATVAAQNAAMARERAQRQQAAAMDTMLTLLGMAAPIAGLALLAWLAWLALAKRWSFDAERGELNVGGRASTLKPLTGAVVGRPTKAMETVISGHGGGGGPNNAPVSLSISSHTVIHDQVFVQDLQGQTHALKLKGWDFPCDEGHRVVAAWLERGGRRVDGSEDPLMLANRTLNTAWTDRRPLMKRLGPMHPYATRAVLIAASLLTYGMGVLLTIPMWLWLSRLSRRRADDVAAALKPWAMRAADNAAAAA